MKITLVVMTLNEIVGMRALMPAINPDWIDQILVIDGGSTDGTIEYCEEHGLEYYIQKKKGIRHAYTEALPLMRGDAILTFSPDGNCRVEDMLPLIKKFKEGDYDMLIASRYYEGAKSEDDDIVTAFGNWLFTGTINWLFKAEFTDAMTIYRIYKKQLIYDLELDKDKWYSSFESIYGTTLSWEPMLSARAAKRRLKLGEALGFEPARIGGERKLQVVRWGLGYYSQFIRDWLFWK